MFEFKQVEPRELLPAVERALGILKERSPLPLAWEEGVPMLLATQCGGDVRKAINACELLYEAAETKDGELLLTSEDALQVVQRSAMRYDKGGDAMYDMASALMKSLRGSDPDAALLWFSRLLYAGVDPKLIVRRIVVHASEDVGLADPRALELAVAAYQACHFLGMPECNVHLAHAVVYLSLSPKSNACYTAYNQAAQDARETPAEPVPLTIRNAPTGLMKDLGYGKDYQYAHDVPGKIARMECLPQSLRGRRYYHPTQEGLEARYKERLEQILQWRKE